MTREFEELRRYMTKGLKLPRQREREEVLGLILLLKKQLPPEK